MADQFNSIDQYGGGTHFLEFSGGRVVATVVDPDGNVLGLIQDKA